MKLRQIIRNIGWDGTFWAFCSIVAFSLGILDFLPQLQLTKDPILRIVLSSIGILLGALVAQTAQRRSEIQEIRSALGLTQSQLIDASTEVPRYLVSNVLQAKHLILDMRLNWATPRYEGWFLAGSHAEYHRLLYQRVAKRELIFKQVEVIFHKQALELVIYRLLLFEGYKYFIRHYDPPPKAIPMIHVMSFDDEVFYLGSFYTGEVPSAAHRLLLRDANAGQIFKGYWSVLWNEASSLNEGGLIEWPKLKQIALRIGLTEKEYDDTLSRLKEQVAHDKRKLKKA